MSELEWSTDPLGADVLIIQMIAGHPEQLPTFAEMDYFLINHSSATIRAQLERLIDYEMVAQVEGDEETFYGFTEEYRSELEEDDLLRATETLQEATLRTQRTQEIEEKMSLERPDWPSANSYTGAVPDMDVIVDE